MNNIPNEIIQNILLLLSPRHALQCSLACKSFYLASRNPILYHTIELYSRSQLEKFIKLATTIKICEKPIGHWVRRVKLIYPFYKYKPTFEDSKLIHVTCPYIIYIEQDLLFPYMDYLTEYKYYNNNSNEDNNDKQWIDYIYDHSISLQIMLSFDDDPTLYIETDEYQQWHKELIGTFNDNVEELINKSNNIEYYGKKIGFTRIFYRLKELCLDFDILKYDFTYELDERTLEAIHASCPLLETLCLSGFIMNISASYNSLPQSSSSDKNQHRSTRFMPLPLLKSLKLEEVTLLQIECFDYLNLKYPQLESLDIYLEWDDLFYRDKDRYTKAIFSMITNHKYLKNLTINDMLLANQFPYNMLIQWLTFNPTQLEKLELYSTDIVFIDEQYKKHQIQQNLIKSNLDSDHIIKELHLRQDYLDHLTDINIQVRSPISTLDYFLREGKRTIASSSIIKIQLIGNYCTLDYFYFYDWLDAFPNLKKLSLKNLCVIGNENEKGNKKSYVLQELGLHQSNIRLKKNITEICQACPLLRFLELDDIGYVDVSTPLSLIHRQPLLDDDSFKPINELTLIDAPQLKLDRLYINNIQYGSFNPDIPLEPSIQQYASLKLVVNEIGLNNTFHIIKKYKAAFFNCIKVNCHSIDVLVFEDNF
ncbi:hypothetical protein BJ944DRAFT_267061 [Cunninghamella echinulata]|nr:hypothetical protein BJ944DRAFT_267061 [Cunninghamella echinulata]